jgi:hypothetical protein
MLLLFRRLCGAHTLHGFRCGSSCIVKLPSSSMMWSDEVVNSISHAFGCDSTPAGTHVLDTSLFAIGTEALPQWKQWSALFEPPCGPAFRVLQIAVATPNAPSPQRKVETLLNAMRALSPAVKGRFDGAMRELFADSDNDEAHGTTGDASRLWATQVIHESMKYRRGDEAARRTKAQDGASVWHCIPVGAHAAMHARGLKLSVGKLHDEDTTARAPHRRCRVRGSGRCCTPRGNAAGAGVLDAHR